MGVGLCEESGNACQQPRNCQGGAPRAALGKNVEADLAVRVNVAVVYARAEAYFRRFERVICRKLYRKKKYP